MAVIDLFARRLMEGFRGEFASRLGEESSRGKNMGHLGWNGYQRVGNISLRGLRVRQLSTAF